jgi:hypothetical protein
MNEAVAFKSNLLLLSLLCGVSVYSVCAPALLDDASDKSAQPAKVKAANKTLTNSNPKITINNPFTETMAEAAGLDPANPSLSSDGLHSGNEGNQKLASSECLFAETLVQKNNTKVTQHLAAEYCDTTKTQKAKQFEAAFPTEDKPGTAMDEALIHIVKWDSGQWTGAWYRYERHKGKGTGVLLPLSANDPVSSPPDHLLAKGGLGFLAIHLNIDDTCDISYGIKSTHVTPLNQQDVSDLISLAESYYAKQKGTSKAGEFPALTSPAVGVWGGQLILSLGQMPASIVFTPSIKSGGTVRGGADQSPQWKVDNTCKPKPGANPPNKDVGIYPHGSKPEHLEYTFASAKGGHLILASESVVSVPREAVARKEALGDTQGQARGSQSNGGSAGADQTSNSAKTDAKSPASDSLSGAALTVIDEGLHWWDVSVAMPVTSFNQLKYSSQDNLIIVKNTNNIKPYALFETYFHPADLRMKSAISFPMIAAGIPFDNQPLQKSFVGTGFTVAIKTFRIQPLVGLRIEKDTRTASLKVGNTANSATLTNNLIYEWHAKLEVMLAFSISDAKKVLGIK